jgi:D-alanine-D-alanine ligase
LLFNIRGYMSMKKVQKSATGRKTNNQRLIDVLGPVENLESYVKADWWRHIFNANYLRTDGDVVNDENITRDEVGVFLSILEVNKDAAILDMCCGQGRHVLEMARQGYWNVHGLDRSHYLINRAKSIAKKEGLSVVFKEGDARKLPFATNKFDVVTVLGNSFGYFETQQDDLQVLHEINRILKPNGKLLIDITDGDHMRASYEPRSWEWIDKNYFVCRERSLSADKERLISREVITHVNKGVIADQFYAERLYSIDGLVSLLNDSGFKDVETKHALNTQSERNQDLGMMAKRNIIMGRVDKPDISLIQGGTKNVLRIAVLQGDPTKSDKIKPGSTFDEDDIHTINELKKALGSLGNYRFTYFDNHDSYFTNLPKWKREFDLVLNLCDEGFNNNALFELHVPAILESMDISYTGGNPQCLAYCYDKSLIRGLAHEMDIPVADAYIVKPEDTTYIDINIAFPVIIKPNFGDSSFGITKNCVCYNVTDLEQAITEVRQNFGYENPILIEQYLTGKDLSVGVIGNSNGSIEFLPIIEEDYSVLPEGLPHICGYEAKWDPQSPYWQIRSIPAMLPDNVEQFLHASCAKLFDRVECRDYARFDWRLDSNGTPRLLEVNPNPGWCWDGHLNRMAGFSGYTYAEMLEKIIEAAIERKKIKSEALPIEAIGQVQIK